MSCDLKSFSSYLDELLESKTFADYAINGLQVEGKRRITHIATAVTASLEVIRNAASLQADLLLVHHGLFLKGRDFVVTGALREKLKALLEHDINLAAYHLPLDAHIEFGNNWAAAKKLGWHNLEPFGFHQGKFIGVKGQFTKKSRNRLQEELEAFYQHPAHTALGGKEEVSSAALITGGAYKSISEAALAGVDCFVTGNFDEPAWHMAFEEKINFFALGHAATEKIGVQLLGAHLSEKFALKHTFIDEANPF